MAKQDIPGRRPTTQPVPAEAAKTYAWPSSPTLIGTSIMRLDGPDKVTGRAKYTFDIARPGMIYGKLIRSPHAHARIVSINLAPARQAPGVKTVFEWKSAGSEVMYQGDVVAAIAAETESQVNDAARLVRVEYEILPHLVNETQALKPDAPLVFQDGNTSSSSLQETGDLDAGFKAAAHIVEAEYSTHVITHVCLESHGAVCEWDGDNLTAWVSTQGVHATRQQIARNLKIPETNVRVICDHMGGGFGSKVAADAPIVAAARLAKEAGRPVKLMLDRKEEHLDAGNRPSAFARVRAGVSVDGMLTAFEATTWGTGGAGQAANFPLPYIYQFPNRRREHTNVYINAGLQRPMRAPGHPQGCFVTEVLMDELADRANMDPLELRLKNLPPTAPDAMWREYYQMGAERFGWDRRHPTGDPTPGPIKTGMGISANTWGGGGRAGNAHIDILSDGSVTVKCGTQDLGTGTRTIVPLIAAETLGLPLAAITAEIGDSALPFAGVSGGSTATAGVGPAVRIAAGLARDALFARVAPTLGVDPEALVTNNSRIQSKDTPSTGMSWKDACKLLGAEPISVDGQWEPGLSSVNTSGVQFAEVTVDIDTGIVKVKRILAIQDCGLVLDKLTTESQVYGGVIGSLNFALFENRLLDQRTGQMVNPNMESYLLGSMADIPEIDVVVVDQPERGIIGVGEPPTVPTASAIANAVRNATGATIRSLPLHPDRVLAALQQTKTGGATV